MITPARNFQTTGCSILGHLNEHGDRRDGADAGDRHQDHEAMGEQLRDEAREFGVDLLDLTFDLPQTRTQLRQDDLVARRLKTVAAGGAILDQAETRDVR